MRSRKASYYLKVNAYGMRKEAIKKRDKNIPLVFNIIWISTANYIRNREEEFTSTPFCYFKSTKLETSYQV
jgi:hypothetical protein